MSQAVEALPKSLYWSRSASADQNRAAFATSHLGKAAETPDSLGCLHPGKEALRHDHSTTIEALAVP